MLEGCICVIFDNKYLFFEKLFFVIVVFIIVGCFIVLLIFNIRILYVVVIKVKILMKVINLLEKKCYEDRYKIIDLIELDEYEIDLVKNDNNFKDIFIIFKIMKDVLLVDIILEMNVVVIEGKLIEKRELRWIINR